MSLDDVLRSIPAMHKKKVSTVARGIDKSKQTKEGWVQAFIACKGDPKRMAQRLTGRSDWETWKDRRMQFLSRHLKQIEDRNELLWKNGQPSRHHLALVAWGYTPTPKQYKEWLKTQPTVASGEWKKGVVMLQKNPRPIPIDKKQIYDISEKIAKKVISWAREIEQLSIMTGIGLDQLTLDDNVTVEKIPKHKKFTFKTSFKTPTDKLLNRDIYIGENGRYERLSSSTKELVIPVIVDLVGDRPYYKKVIHHKKQ